jgi:hypothetical protein
MRVVVWVSLLALTGCYERTMSIKLADPARVSLATGSSPALPAEPASAT